MLMEEMWVGFMVVCGGWEMGAEEVRDSSSDLELELFRYIGVYMYFYV